MYHIVDVFTPTAADARSFWAYQAGVQRVTHIMLWDDVSENVRAVCKAAGEGRIQGITLPPDYDWIGRHEQDMDTWDDVVRAVENPWPYGLKKVEEMLEHFRDVQLPVPRSMRRRPVWSGETGDFDLDRHLEGQDCWRATSRRDIAGQQFITIVVQIGASGSTSSSSMIWRGVAAIVLTQILEEQGYSVEIIAYDYGRDSLVGPRDILHTVWIKRSDQPVDKSALVNAVSSWYFRVINLASYSLVPGHTVRSGFGYDGPAPERLYQYLAPNGEFWNINKVWSRWDAESLVREHLNKLAEPELADA